MIIRVLGKSVLALILGLPVFGGMGAFADSAQAQGQSPATPTGPYPPPPQPQYPPPYPPPPIFAQTPAPTPATSTHFGVGYKIGNGLGFVGGDIIVSPLPHLAFDFQANTFSIETSTGIARGYGLAPAVQAYLRDPGLSTPYLDVGFVYASLKIDKMKATGKGVFANFGYEWKWSSGLGILLGGGLAYYDAFEATDGASRIEREGGGTFNLEASLRFMFF